MTVTEPTLRVGKTASSPTIDANDPLTYTVVVDHAGASNADAFDVVLSDLIPAGLTFVPGSLSESGTTTTTLAFTGPDTIAATWTNFPQGSATTITFDVTVSPTYNPVAPITNTAGITYTGLPGSPASPLSPTGVERTGAGGVNDYATSGAAVVQPIAPTLGKALVDTSAPSTGDPNVTIGEIVTYDLTATLPEGEISGFTITDQLPTGMQYVSGSLEVFTTAGGPEVPSAGLTATFDGSLGASAVSGGASNGADVVVTFGATTVTPDGDPDDNTIIVRLDARVLDVPGNVGLIPGQVTLNNTGQIQLNGSSVVTSGVVGTPVVEPRLVISKSFDPTTASQGDTVTVAVSVENTGLGIAHDVVIDDVLDAYFDETTAAEGTTAAGFTYSRVGNAISWVGGPIAPGATIDFSFTVALDAVVPIGTSIPNTARVTQATTLPGTVSGERDEPDVFGPAVLNSVGPDLVLSKDDGVTTIVPGSQTTYTLIVTNVGGFEATGVRIDDTLPAGTTFVGVGGDARCTDGGVVGSARRIDIADPIPAGGGFVTCTITIEMTAPAAAGTSGYLNTAVAADDGVNGPDPTPTNNEAEDTDVIAGRAPDVEVTKDDGVTEVAPGGQTTYTVTVTNAGNIGVTNVLVTDTLPPGLSFSACNELTGVVSVSCAESGGIITITYASLAGAGGSATFEIVADVDDPVAAGLETVENRVTADDDGANGFDANASNNEYSDVDDVTAQPDMTITKTHAQATVATGGTVDYTLTVGNVGDQNATGVVVTDTVDPQTTVQCGSVAPVPTSCDAGTGVITWGPGLEDSTGSVTGGFIAGGSRVLTYQTVVDSPVLAGTIEFVNTADVTDDDGTADGDPTPLDNVATDTIPLAGNAPELSIVKDDGVTVLAPGDLTTYTLTVTNNGDIGATGVVITDTLPAALAFDSCSDACDSSAAPVITWSSPGISGTVAGGGGSVLVTITARVIDPAMAGISTITNEATVSEDGANGIDPIPENNRDDDIDALVAVPDLTVTKDDGATERAAGESFDYTIVVSNVGDQEATGVVVVDTLPDVLTANSCPAVPVPCTIDAGAGTVTWNLGALNGGADDATPAPNSSVTLTVNVTVDATVASTIDSFLNEVRVDDDGTNGADPTPDDNEADDTDDLVATPDFHITKSDGTAIAAPGGTLVYELVVTNVGAQAATSVTVTDMLPPGVTFVGCAPTCDATALPIVTWTDVVEDVAGSPSDPAAFDASGQATLTVTVTVDDPADVGLEEIDNEATVVDDGTNGADPTPGDNVANDVDVIDAAPDLVVSKDDGVDQVNDGQVLTYRIAYRNAGNQQATGVVITDTLPAEVSFVGCSDSCDSAGAPTIVWAIGDLAAGATGEVTITARVDDPVDPSTRHIVNTVVIADDGTNGADPTPADNSDTDDDTYGIDLAVDKTDGRSSAVPGEDVTYTITVTNNGPTTIREFDLVDEVPDVLLDVEFTASAGTYDATSGRWASFGDFVEGETFTLTVTGRIDPSATGTIVNTVTVTPPDTVVDRDPSNDVATDTDTLEPRSDLVLTKRLIGELAGGADARYEITVTNDGPSDASAVTVTDRLPNGLALGSATGTGWRCTATANEAICDLADTLPVGETAMITVVARVTAAAGTTITNTATVSMPTGLGTDSVTTDTAVSVVPSRPTPPLPRTGSGVMTPLTWGFALVMGGLVLLRPRRYRRTPR